MDKQTTLNTLIEKKKAEAYQLVMTDWQKMEGDRLIEIKPEEWIAETLKEIAQATVEAVRVEIEDFRIKILDKISPLKWEESLTEANQFARGYNQGIGDSIKEINAAISEQEKKEKEWLGV